jgi:membrane protease YdiL (CAAX protease family)
MSNDSSSSPTETDPSVSAPKRPRSGWWLAPVALLATIVIFYSAQIFGAVIVELFVAINYGHHVRGQDLLTTSVTAQFAYGLLADGLVVGGVALMLKLLQWRWADIGLKKPQWWHIAVGLVAAVPYYILYAIAVVAISALIPSLNIDQKQQIGFNNVHGSVALIMTFISLVVLPPLAEEITMRGFLYSGLKKLLPRVVAALVVSFLFGAAHLLEGGEAGPLWIGAIDTFILSLVLVFLREATGNLWAGITLHAVKNSLAFLSLFILHLH